MTLKMTLLSWGKGTEGRSGRPKFRSKQSCLFKVFQSKNSVMKSTFSCLLKPLVTLTRCEHVREIVLWQIQHLSSNIYYNFEKLFLGRLQYSDILYLIYIRIINNSRFQKNHKQNHLKEIFCPISLTLLSLIMYNVLYT